MTNNTVHEGTNRSARYMRSGGIAAIVLGLVTSLAAWRGSEIAAERTAEAQSAARTAAPAAQVAPVERSAGPSAAAGTFRASYADIVDKVSPGVVTVRVEGRTQPTPTSGQFDSDDLQRFFGRQFRVPQQPRRSRGLGSGVIVSQDGYILTNNHVVDGADQIRVETKERRVYDAKVIGTDPDTDLAVIKVDGKGLPAVPFGNSDQVRVGDVVLAFGNPLNVGQTVTMGIVSAKGRATGAGDINAFEDFLQTDAPINQGNSGGALVNANAELVGINSQILTPSMGNIGIGFAIPVNMARNVMDQLVKNGKVQRSKLGVAVQGVTADVARSLGMSDVRGGLVSNVESGSPAARAGIRQGDVILEVDGRAIGDGNELRNVIGNSKPGTTVSLKVLRDGRQETVQATLAELQSPRQLTDRSPSARDGGGKFGMTLQPLTPQVAEELELPRGSKGVAVADVDPDGEAAAGGIRPGDVIQKVNGRDVTTIEEVRDALAKTTTEKPALVLVAREGTTQFLTLRAPRG